MNNDEQKSKIEVAKEKGKEVFNQAMQSETVQKGKNLFDKGKARFFALPKKTQYIVFGICAVLVLLFIFSGGNNPEDVVKKFSKAVVNREYEKAVQYLEPEGRLMLLNLLKNGTSGMLEMIDPQGLLIDDEVKKKAQEDFLKRFDFKILKSTVKGDEASVEVETKNSEGEIEKDTLELKKIDGEWLICN